MLRQLSSFCERRTTCTASASRRALLHLGKGLITLHPQHSDRLLTSPTALAGLATVCFLALDMKKTLCHHEMGYFLYMVVCAMRPRMLCMMAS